MRETMPTLDSIAILERLPSHDSMSEDHWAAIRHGKEAKYAQQNRMTMHITLASSILLGSTAVVVAAIVWFVYRFEHGMEWYRIENKFMNATERDQLLDKFNGYSGNITSIFMKPIEVSVTMLIQIVVLRFCASAMLSMKTSWKVSVGALGATILISYLINSGFNALNVQLRPADIQPVIYDLDLVGLYNPRILDDELWTNRMHSYSELQHNNSIMNTVLRGLAFTNTPNVEPYCFIGEMNQCQAHSYLHAPSPVAYFGIASRRWHPLLLREARVPTKLRVVVNPTNATANRLVEPSKLPMDATTTASLFLYGLRMGLGPQLWSPPTFVANVSTSIPYVERIGLLPMSSVNIAETDKRKSFLRESAAVWGRAINNSKRVETYSTMKLSDAI